MTERPHETNASDLRSVDEIIGDAKQAEDQLLSEMPNAIQPDDDAYEGMTGYSAGNVAEADPEVKTADERQARTSEETVTEKVEDAVVQDEPERSADDKPAL
jgi:hypothetical protein